MMHDQDQLVPEERDAQNSPLLNALHQLYDTRERDAQSLARIRTRLLNEVPNLPASTPSIDEFSIRSSRRSKEREGKMDMFHFPTGETRGWSHRLSIIAAAVLVALVVGTLALLLQRTHIQVGGPHNNLNLPPGWTAGPSYSGKGSSVISGQSVHLNPLWGYILSCNGKGQINADFTDMNSGAGANCVSGTTVPTNNIIVQFQAASTILQSFKITVPTSASWTLQFVNGPNAATPLLNHLLAQNSGWSFYEGMGGTSSASSNSATAPSNVTMFGLLSYCYGNASFDFYAPAGTLVTKNLACDGHVHFMQLQAVVGKSIEVRSHGNGHWTIGVLTCTNTRQCQQTLSSLPKP